MVFLLFLIKPSHARFTAMWWRYERIRRRVERDASPDRDLAMPPVHDSELGELEMFSAPQGARIAVEKLHRRTAARTATAPVSH